MPRTKRNNKDFRTMLIAKSNMTTDMRHFCAVIYRALKVSFLLLGILPMIEPASAIAFPWNYIKCILYFHLFFLGSYVTVAILNVRNNYHCDSQNLYLRSNSGVEVHRLLFLIIARWLITVRGTIFKCVAIS